MMTEDEALGRLQATELEMLKVFKQWCHENQLTWFVDSGTVLGAARHGGFIPWDDDIDVGMPREDYNRMLVLAKTAFPAGYSIHTPLDMGYTSLFAKMYKDSTEFCTAITEFTGCKQSIYIDIFPYDYAPREARKLNSLLKRCANSQRLMYLYYLKDIDVPHSGFLGLFEKTGCRLGHYLAKAVLKPRVIVERFENRIAEACLNADSSKLTSYPWAGYVPIFDSSILLPVVELEFEDISVPVPHDFDMYLKLLYGDWHKLPAENERHTHLPVKLRFIDGAVWVRDSKH